MKIKSGVGLAVKIALFYCTLAGFCQSIQAQTEMQFRLVRNTVIVVPMMAGGEGPFDFVLDTGADTTIVDPSLGDKLSLSSLSHIQQTTLAGNQASSVSRIAALGSGQVQVRNLPVLVQDLAEIRKLDPQVQGIAGQDFLSHFNYLLDYPKHTIRFELADEIRDAIEGDRVPVEVVGNKMMVASEARSYHEAKLSLRLDSGTNSVVMMRTASQTLDLLTHQTGMAATSGGQVGMQVGRLDQLKVGSQRFQNISVALSSLDSSDRYGDGLLPTALFHVLYVNNRESFVMFNPKARKK
jgi:predicted aspartyl protease